MIVLMSICVVRFLIVGAACGPVERPPKPHVPGQTRSGCPVQDMGHCGVQCCQERVLVWRGFRGPGRWSQRRTRSTLLLQGPGGVANRLVRRMEVQRYTATPSSRLAMGATISGGGKHKKAKASAATAAAAPTAMAPSPFVLPSVVQAIQGVQQVCSSSTVVSAGSTVRLNRLHRLQPCTVERHLPTH